MIQNILITSGLRKSMPNSIKVKHNFGNIIVIFEDGEMVGDNAIIEGEPQDIIDWLKPFDGVAVGVGGNPQFELFEIMHIKDNL